MSIKNDHYWIWPQASSLSAEGSLRFKTSGVDRNGLHWTAEENFFAFDHMHPAMTWVYQNRSVLPSLIVRSRVKNDLNCEVALNLMPDGIYVSTDENLTVGWSESLKLPITVVTPKRSQQTLSIIFQLTGANCLLFLAGTCTAAISVAHESTDECVTSQQALTFFKSLTYRSKKGST